MPRRVALLLTAVALLTLNACGSGNDTHPAALPTLAPTSSAPSPTTSPTAVLASATAGAVARPVGADSESAASAEMFVRYYFDVLEAALRDSDPRVLVALSDPKCQLCGTYANSISARARQGQHIRFAGYTLHNVVSPMPEDGQTQVLVDFDAPESPSVDANGAVIEPEGPHLGLTATVGCSWSIRGWSVSNLDITQTR